MALDPKKFALLTSAIAASIVVVGASTAGCSDAAVDDDGDGGSSSGEATSSSGGGSSSGGTSSGGTSSGGGSSSGGADGGADGGTCLGDEGVAPTCDDLGTGCFASEERDYMCPGFASVFKPSVAHATIDCLKISPSCEEGEELGAPECATDAVAAACTDDDPATIQAFCEDVLDRAECEDAALLARCKAFYPALSQEGQDGLKFCADDSSGCGLFEFCVDPTYASSALVPIIVD